MKDNLFFLLCAVALAHGFDLRTDQKARTCNCDPTEAQQICEANYGNDNVLIAHENCDKFYKCSNGKPVAYNCPDKLLYNPFREECDWPHNVECGDRPISDGNESDDADCDDDTGSDNDSVGGDGNDSGNEGPCNCNPGEAPSICAAEGSNGILVAHENCNQFYMCAEGRPVTLNCPPSLLYNPHKGECDWSHNVECGDRVIPEPDSDAGNDSDNDENDSGVNEGTCNCNPEEAPTICGAAGSDGVLIAHENCNQFYICDNSKPVAVSCSGTLVFNPYTEQCDWPRNVDCGDRIVPETEGGCTACNESGENNDSSDSSENNDVAPPADNDSNDSPDIDDLPPAGDDDSNDSPDIDDLPPAGDDDSNDSPDIDDVPPAGDDDGNNNGTCNCNPGEAPSICEASDSDGVLVAHENCNQFYKCSHGKPVVYTCPENLLYNGYTEKCDWPENVDCGDRVIPDPEDNDSGNDSDSNENGNDSGNNDNGGAGNCDPSEAPTICAADDSNGILVAHENCNQFYKCSYGKPVALKCPGNLKFNPITDQCDWPENVDCGDRVIPDSEENDSGNNSGGNDSGSDNGNDSGSDSGSDNGNDSGSDNGNDSGNNDNGGAGNCDPSEAPTICAADDSNGVLVAHENCNQFYKCAYGKPVALKCPGNLQFNPITDQCDWPENVECGDRVIPDSEENDSGNNSGGNDSGSDNGNDSGSDSGSDNGNDSGNNDNGGAGNCDPSEAPTICAADDSNGVLVAHENCNQFYKCAYGKPVALKCPGNLQFNPDTDQCDWPENVDCGDRVIPNPDDDSNDSGNDNGDLPPGGDDSGNDNGGNDNGGSDNGGGDNNSTCNCNPGEAPSICAAEDSSGVLVAHENCNQFYKCDHGKPVVFTCPGNLLYNAYSEQCDWPENVECGDRVVPDLEDDSNDSGNDSGDLPPGGDDSGNDNGGNDNGGDDNGGGDNNGTCNCNPGEAPSICATEDSSGILVAHENCNQFYKCDHGKPVVFTCPGKLLYNAYSEECDWPENVECGDRVIPDLEDSDSGNDSSGNDNGSDNGNDSDNNDNDNGGAGNCDPSEAPTICAADDSDGILVAHENCNQFYMCSGSKPVALKCPGDLLFNSDTDRCDWPENVDCGDRVIPDPEDDSDDNENDSSDIGDDSSNGGGGNDNSGSDNDGTCNCNPEEAPSICAGENSNGTLIAHENCNQFYKCDHGKPVAFTCPENLSYNPSTEKCDWPEKVDCGDRIIPDSEDESDDIGNDSDNVEDLPPGGDDSGNDNESDDLDDLPPGGDDIGNDNGGNDNESNDSTGNEGDTDPDDSDCDDNSGNENDDSCNCKPDEAPSICAIDGSDGVLIAHENCNQFYKCDNGKPVAFRCPSNLLYNPVAGVCDWPFNVECGDRVIADFEDDSDENNAGDSQEEDDSDNDNGGTCNCNPEEAPAICAVDGSDGVLIAHENCNQFYQCSFGSPVAVSCASNLLYNPFIQTCDWPANVECGDRVIPKPEDRPDDNVSDVDDEDDSGNHDVNDDPSQAPAICAGSGSEGVLVAHENCNQFYVCSGGSPVALACGDNLLFNPLNNQCDWPRNVDCGDRIVPGDGDDCACNPRNAPALCSRPDSNGKLIAHEICNQFYMCNNAVPVAFDCPDNLHYNTDKEMCDWPQNVNCENRMLSYASLNKHLDSRQTLRK